MNTYMKAIVMVGLSSTCITAIAADTFIVKYKLTKAQYSFLLSHSDSSDEKKKANTQITRELMKTLSQEQLDTLSRAANVKEAIDDVQVTDLHSLANGAHVIKLGKDLDSMQIKQFIHNVELYSDIDFIEEDKIMYTSH